MGILNPVLWIFFALLALAIGTVALLISVAIGGISFFYLKRKTNRTGALQRAIIIAYVAFFFLFLAGCILSLLFPGPLAL
jgi:hypothetical protein